MTELRRIAVITTTRAEYGLLRWLIAELAGRSDVETQLIVTGTHLEGAYGRTVTEIEADGYPIAARIPMELAGDDPASITRSVATLVDGLAGALQRLEPHLLVLLGDRFELLGAAQAATLAGVPIAHLHGGEITEGAFDDAIRHALTKLSHLHFVATEEFARRVRQLGEDPHRVWVVGGLGLDGVGRVPSMERDDLTEALGVAAGMPFFLVTVHPATLGDGDSGTPVDGIIAVLQQYPGYAVVITHPNADPGRAEVLEKLERFAATEPERVVLRPSLGQHLYVNAMRHAELLLGNSSSGIIEAPSAGVPSVNVGDREAGRPRAESVFDAGEDVLSIVAAVERALAWRTAGVRAVNPYGDGGASRRVADILVGVDLEGLTRKRFVDVPTS